MLAHARSLGFVFNSLSVYWCYGPDGSMACVLAEIHNTYAERHCYLLRPDSSGRATPPSRCTSRRSTARRAAIGCGCPSPPRSLR